MANVKISDVGSVVTPVSTDLIELEQSGGTSARTTLGQIPSSILPVTAAGNIASTNVQAALYELDDEKGPYSSGFVNRTDTSLAFDAGTRVFTLTKVNDFVVYAGGKKWSYTASQTTTIANTTGFHFFYVDTDGVLKNGMTAWDIAAGLAAPVATVYFNTSGPAASLPFDERHSYLRNAQAHAILHQTVGAYWINGLVGTFGDTNGSISVTTGTYADEDIVHTVGSTITTAKLVYRSGGAWVIDSANADIRKQAGGILQYDNAGTLGNVTSGRYTNYWAFLVNTVTPEIHVVVGQTESNLAATITSESVSSLTLPPWISSEGKLLYRITYERTVGTPAGDIYTTPTDFRGTRLTGGTVTGNVTGGDAHAHTNGAGAQIDHTTLSNIGTNTHAQIDTHIALAVTTPAANSIPKADANGYISGSWIKRGTVIVTGNGSTTQSIATGTLTKMTDCLATELLDEAGWWNTTDKKFQPTEAGNYLCIVKGGFGGQAAAIGVALCCLRKNGTDFMFSTRPYASVVGSMDMQAIAVIPMNGSTDYVEAFIFHGYGSNINTSSVAYTIGFMAFKL